MNINRILIERLPHNGNTGIVPPWLTTPVIPVPVPPTEPVPTRPWWIDDDWDEERRDLPHFSRFS
jgi:hypothetical protein